MIAKILRTTMLAFAIVPGAIVGCGGGGETVAPVDVSQMREVESLIRAATSNRGKPPASVTDLAPFQQVMSLGYQAVKSGEIVICWGAAPADEGGGGSAEIIAYQKKVPTEGGQVLLQNGTVKAMTAAEFSSSPKAGKK